MANIDNVDDNDTDDGNDGNDDDEDNDNYDDEDDDNAYLVSNHFSLQYVRCQTGGSYGSLSQTWGPGSSEHL